MRGVCHRVVGISGEAYEVSFFWAHQEMVWVNPLSVSPSPPLSGGGRGSITLPLKTKFPYGHQRLRTNPRLYPTSILPLHRGGREELFFTTI